MKGKASPLRVMAETPKRRANIVKTLQNLDQAGDLEQFFDTRGQAEEPEVASPARRDPSPNQRRDALAVNIAQSHTVEQNR